MYTHNQYLPEHAEHPPHLSAHLHLFVHGCLCEAHQPLHTPAAVAGGDAAVVSDADAAVVSDADAAVVTRAMLPFYANKATACVCALVTLG